MCLLLDKRNSAIRSRDAGRPLQYRQQAPNGERTSVSGSNPARESSSFRNDLTEKAQKERGRGVAGWGRRYLCRTDYPPTVETQRLRASGTKPKLTKYFSSLSDTFAAFPSPQTSSAARHGSPHHHQEKQAQREADSRLNPASRVSAQLLPQHPVDPETAQRTRQRRENNRRAETTARGRRASLPHSRIQYSHYHPPRLLPQRLCVAAALASASCSLLDVNQGILEDRPRCDRIGEITSKRQTP